MHKIHSFFVDTSSTIDMSLINSILRFIPVFCYDKSSSILVSDLIASLFIVDAIDENSELHSHFPLSLSYHTIIFFRTYKRSKTIFIYLQLRLREVNIYLSLSFLGSFTHSFLYHGGLLGLVETEKEKTSMTST